MAVVLKNNCNIKFLQAFNNICTYNINSFVLNFKKYSSSSPAEVGISEDVEETNLLNAAKERNIEAKRNVSRLNPQHRNMVRDNMPYPEPQADFHLSVKYRRKMYGLYGSASGVNPGVMWPTKEDIQERKEYERVAYPLTIQEMVREEVSKKEAEEASLISRQNEIKENMKKLNQWMKDLENKRAKKIQVALEAKMKKDRLIEEVRRHFGYTVDHRDERFQTMLEQKEKEQRKSAKLERRKKRDEMIMQELIEQTNKQMK